MVRDFVRSSRFDNQFWSVENRQQILCLLDYATSDKNFSELEGLKLIPMSNNTFQFFSKSREKIYLTKDKDLHKIFQNKMSSRFVDIGIDSRLLDALIEISQKCPSLNLILLDIKEIPKIIKQEYFDSSTSEIFRFNSFVTESWIKEVWKYINRKDVDLSTYHDMQLVKVRNGFLIKLKALKNSSAILLQDMSNELLKILEGIGCYFVENYPMRSDLYKNYLHSSSHYGLLMAISTLSSPNYPKDDRSRILLRNHLSNCDFALLSNEKKIFQNILFAFPIFETYKGEFVSLQNCNSYYFPPKNYHHISHNKLIKRFENDTKLIEFLQIKPMQMGKFFLKFFLDCINDFTTEEQFQLNNEMLQNINQLLLEDNFKSILEEKEFIPDTNSVLKRPKDLFDPHEEILSSIYEKEEPFFPHHTYQSKKVVNSLKLLQLKSMLTIDDLIERARNIQILSLKDINFARARSEKLLKYFNNNYHHFQKESKLDLLKIIEWVPSFIKDKKTFSSPNKIFLSEYKDFISLVHPYLDYKPNESKMIKFFSWDRKPTLDDLLKQFEIIQQENINLNKFEKLIYNVYQYFQTVVEGNNQVDCSQLKKFISQNKWIYHKECKNQRDLFFDTEQFVFKCDIDLSPYYFLLMESYSNNFHQLFKFAGVRENFDDLQ